MNLYIKCKFPIFKPLLVYLYTWSIYAVLPLLGIDFSFASKQRQYISLSTVCQLSECKQVLGLELVGSGAGPSACGVGSQLGEVQWCITQCWFWPFNHVKRFDVSYSVWVVALTQSAMPSVMLIFSIIGGSLKNALRFEAEDCPEDPVDVGFCTQTLHSQHWVPFSIKSVQHF